MKYIRLLITSFFIATIGFSLSEASSTETGLQYLKLPVFARPEGMGGAYVALAEGASSLFYNPAGPASNSRSDFHFSAGHTDWMLKTKKTSAVFLLPSYMLSRIYFQGLTVDYFSAAGLYEYDDAGAQLGSLTYYDMALGLNFGTVGNTFTAGTTLKLLFENIAGYEGFGFAADIGLLYTLNPRVRLGVSALNLGSFALDGEDVSLPWRIRAGAAVFAHEIVTVVADFEQNAAGSGFHVGTEVATSEDFTVRAGWNNTPGGSSYTLGAGFQTLPPEDSEWGGQAFLNYGMSSGGNMDKTFHRFDAGIRFNPFSN